MKDLVDRARAAMNLILVVSLLLAWIALQPPPTSSLEEAQKISAKVKTWAPDFGLEFPTPTTKVQRFLEQSRLALEQFDRLSQAGESSQPGENLSFAELLLRGSPAFREIIRHGVALPLAELESTYEPFQADDLAFQELDQRRERKVKIPFIEQEVPAERALLLIAIGLTGPYLYLLSTILAMSSVSVDEAKDEWRSWVFFHTHWLGMGVGVAWLGLPVLALFVGTLLRTEGAPNELDEMMGLGAYLVLAALAWGCVTNAYTERKRLISTKQSSSGTVSTEASTESEHSTHETKAESKKTDDKEQG